jgi:MFS transporter, YNFM family, putative membrane transport protein
MNASSGPVPVRTLVFLAAACFASAASLRASDPILPDIAQAFATTPGDAAKVITFFGAAYALSQFLYGFIGERYGYLRIVTRSRRSCPASVRFFARSPARSKFLSSAQSPSA